MLVNRNINKKKLLTGREVRWSLLAFRSNIAWQGDIIWENTLKITKKKMLPYFILKLKIEFMNLFTDI